MIRRLGRFFYYGLPAVLVAYPIISFLWMSLLRKSGGEITGPLTLENYVRAFTDTMYVPLLLRSIELSVAVSAICVVSAYLLAVWVASLAGRAKMVAILVFVAPLLMNYIVKIYAIRALLGNNGFINRSLLSAGLIDKPIETFTFNMNSVFLTLVILLTPFAFLPIYLAIEQIDRKLVDAARDLGASDGYIFRRIVFPLTKPSVVLSASFVFVLAMGDFVTPEMVGGTSGFTFGRVIYSQFGSAFNWPFGSALSALLMIVVTAALWSGARMARVRGLQ
ncbi:ABC transporter permease [Mesorhizobium sp. M3A.F.Ca.ET.201.01.1.1]|uniref:ABC transporter permease n=1 Tax=Mesorhizobium sp. M3A.F.Ca.ET.201.01.1.1 TaxID=2563946 RepID=UPI001093B28F|nr:ABC transporter permease [Mesorhizobium sp. M3A.F.Ca.ET.201.01.1.1]TGS71749.1 ABC transporter permease [Mesorhizobium sp. M3A.F.Ca.ET.201.01.1.1]